MFNNADASKTASTAVVLSIAGSDNTGGAGIQADIKTGAAFGVYVATAITAITVQGVGQVKSYPVSPEQLEQQIQSVLESLPIKAIKVGMLGSAELLLVVARLLDKVKLPVVVDPVLIASAGGVLCGGEQVTKLYREQILPLTTLLTPNLVEAAALLGQSVAKDESIALAQGHQLLELGAQAVLLKGGHSDWRLATDFLITQDQEFPYSAPWLSKKNTHGSGCTMASAIAAGLAQGLTLPQAVAASKSFIQGAIQHAERLQLMADKGPVHHFYQYW